MAIAITCAQCGFVYGYTDEEIEYAGFLCPGCHTTAPRVEIEVDPPGEAPARASAAPAWAVVDRIRTIVSGPFPSRGDAARWIGRHCLDHRMPLAIVPHEPANGQREAGPRGQRVPPERIPMFVDAFDIRLARWIAEAMLDF